MKHNFLAFYLLYFFVGIYVLNEKYKTKKNPKFKDCLIINQNAYDLK